MKLNFLKHAIAFANTPPTPDQIYLSTSQVGNRLGMSRTTIWRLMKNDPNFPSPIHFGAYTRRWCLADVQEWEELNKSQSPAASKGGE